MLTLWAFCGTEEKGGKRGGMAGIGACVVRSRLTLGTAPGAEEREGKGGGMGALVLVPLVGEGSYYDWMAVLRAMGRGRGWENSGAKAASGIFPPVGAGSCRCRGLWRQRPALRRDDDAGAGGVRLRSISPWVGRRRGLKRKKTLGKMADAWKVVVMVRYGA
ncbi:hypothetical protein ROHU_037294 [Labeo rohita]|uniref:Uncharacterized protein n=1 Tax=Labeo rohita TaxID=84645 RepID=A0A498LU44_LABRO|nr:hypothetical protein ROHU_035866 [Labeo rohita]RXN11640.1 hypothetical protein ROHU_037294 [Labeo rohita]